MTDQDGSMHWGLHVILWSMAIGWLFMLIGFPLKEVFFK